MLHTPANSSNAPLRILSFDLECFVPDAKKTGRLFSYPRFDPVFQIANMVTRYGEQQPFTRNVFTLNSCDPIDGCQVMSYDNESDMLKQWAKFVKEADPDIIIGYNIARFDLPYLLLRARALGIKEETFFDITKLVDVPIYIEEHKLGQQREWKDAPDVSGRLLFDLLHFTLKYNPGSVSGPGMFRLGPTCERVLGEKKEDVAFTEVNSLQFGDATTRRRLAIYCCKDAYLPQKLLDKTSAFRRYVEDSCKALLPFDATLLLSPGQLSKSSNQIHDITNGILKPTRSYFSF
ncbi:ribonuclease H-like domain-containing protein [Cyathus striatus]|nr:ribonuclease H-like domain-containing protein [Cyathus striatus]